MVLFQGLIIVMANNYSLLWNVFLSELRNPEFLRYYFDYKHC